MKLTIDRNIWLRGKNAFKTRTAIRGGPNGVAVEEQVNNSYLLRPDDGKRCCVGIYLAACGVQDSDLRGQRDVTDVEYRKRDTLPGQCMWLVEELDEEYRGNSTLAEELYGVNDRISESLTEREREAKVKEIFAENGVDVEFVG